MDMPDVKSPQGKKILIGAGVVLVVGIAYYRHKQNSTSTSSSTSAGAIDPATGYPYGSPEDAQALADQGSYQTPQDYTGSDGTGSGTGGGGGSSQPTNNQQWYSDALGKVIGPRTAVADALSRYLAGEKVSPQQKAYIEQAIASVNYPPNSGANGYPPHIREGGAHGPDRQLKAPTVRIAAHYPRLNKVHLRWGAVSNANGYEVHSNTGHVQDVKGTGATVADGHSYYVVAVHPGVFIASPPSNTVNAPNVQPAPHHHKKTPAGKGH